MKIWTSYFAKLDKLRQLGFKDFVAVSGYVPEFYQNVMDNNPYKHLMTCRRCIELAPKKSWFFDWKNGKFDNDEYVRLYSQTVLNTLDIKEVLKQFENNTVLLCYEKSGDFCHRHLIAQWLKDNGIECEEVDTNV